jgi:hypothetical protein
MLVVHIRQEIVGGQIVESVQNLSNYQDSAKSDTDRGL